MQPSTTAPLVASSRGSAKQPREQRDQNDAVKPARLHQPIARDENKQQQSGADDEDQALARTSHRCSPADSGIGALGTSEPAITSTMQTSSKITPLASRCRFNAL